MGIKCKRCDNGRVVNIHKDFPVCLECGAIQLEGMEHVLELAPSDKTCNDRLCNNGVLARHKHPLVCMHEAHKLNKLLWVARYIAAESGGEMQEEESLAGMEDIPPMPVSPVKVVVTGVRFELDGKFMMNLEEVAIKDGVGYELCTTRKYATKADLVQVLDAAKNWLDKVKE